MINPAQENNFKQQPGHLTMTTDVNSTATRVQHGTKGQLLDGTLHETGAFISSLV